MLKEHAEMLGKYVRIKKWAEIEEAKYETEGVKVPAHIQQLLGILRG
jgi:hypothetical protein